MSVFLFASVQGWGLGGVLTSMPVRLTGSVSVCAPCRGGEGAGRWGGGD